MPIENDTLTKTDYMYRVILPSGQTYLGSSINMNKKFNKIGPRPSNLLYLTLAASEVFSFYSYIDSLGPTQTPKLLVCKAVALHDFIERVGS